MIRSPVIHLKIASIATIELILDFHAVYFSDHRQERVAPCNISWYQNNYLSSLYKIRSHLNYILTQIQTLQSNGYIYNHLLLPQCYLVPCTPMLDQRQAPYYFKQTSTQMLLHLSTIHLYTLHPSHVSRINSF